MAAEGLLPVSQEQKGTQTTEGEVRFRNGVKNNKQPRPFSQDFEWKETPLQKIAKKVQNRFSWSGEEIELILGSKSQILLRKKSTNSNTEKQERRRSWLDHLLGNNHQEIEDLQRQLKNLRVSKDNENEDNSTETKEEESIIDDASSLKEDTKEDSREDSKEDAESKKLKKKKKTKKDLEVELYPESPQKSKKKKEKSKEKVDNDPPETPTDGKKSKKKSDKDKTEKLDKGEKNEKSEKNETEKTEVSIEEKRNRRRTVEINLEDLKKRTPKSKEKSKEKIKKQDDEKHDSEDEKQEGEKSEKSKKPKKPKTSSPTTEIPESLDSEDVKKRNKSSETIPDETDEERKKELIVNRIKMFLDEDEDDTDSGSLIEKKKQTRTTPKKEKKEKKDKEEGITEQKGSKEDVLTKEEQVSLSTEKAPMTKEEMVLKKKDSFKIRSISSGTGLNRQNKSRMIPLAALPEKNSQIIRSQTFSFDPNQEEAVTPVEKIDEPVVQFRNKDGLRNNRARHRSLAIELQPATEVGETFFKDSFRTGFCIPHRFTALPALSSKIFKIQHCHHCKQTIWGIRSHAAKCQDCGLMVHQHCAPLVPPTCGMSQELLLMKQQLESKGIVKKRSDDYFGQDIEMQAKEEGRLIPRLVSMCVASIEERGLDTEGLYRIPGSTVQIDKLKLLFSYGRPKLEANEWPDISVITGVLKLYFRELPVPLGTYSLYDSFMACARIDDEIGRLMVLQNLLQSLPAVNYATMRFMIKHLKRVADHSQNNLMKSPNLALIIGPAFFRSQNQAQNLYDMHNQSKLIDVMIRNCPIIFPSSDKSISETFYRNSTLL